MTLRVERVTSRSDMPALVRIFYASFMTSTIYQALYPKGATPSLVIEKEKNYAASLESEPGLRMLKVLDDDTGKTIAIAKWYIFETAEAERERKHPRISGPLEDVNKEVANEFFGKIAEARKTMAGKPHCFKHWRGSFTRLRLMRALSRRINKDHKLDLEKDSP